MKVKGMHCKSCEMLLEDSLKEKGATKVSVSYKTGELEVEGLSKEDIEKVVKEEGYTL